MAKLLGKDINIGDKVLYFAGTSFGEAVVKRITPSGLIDVNGVLFTDQGKERRGASTFRYREIDLFDADRAEEARVARAAKKRRDEIHQVSFTKMDQASIDEIHRVLVQRAYINPTK